MAFTKNSSDRATTVATGDALRTLLNDSADIKRRIESIGDERTVNNLMRTSTLAGARVIRDAARQNVAVDNGELKKNIIARTRRKRAGSKEIRSTVTINPKSRARNIAHLVEFGTSQHEQKKLNFIHPGAKAQPFIRPAIDENRREILEAVANKAEERLRKLNV